jgi:hypothetical protein
MRKIILAIILFHVFFSKAYSQETKHANIIFSNEIGGSFTIVAPRAVGFLPRYWVLRNAPTILFGINKRFYIGVTGEHESGRFENEKIPSLKGFGLTSRYYFSENLIKNQYTLNRLQLYAQLSYLLLDYRISPASRFGISKLEGYTNQNAQLILGGNLRLFSNFYLDLGGRLMYYTLDSKWLLTQRGGFEYHFGEKRKKLPPSTWVSVATSPEKHKPFDFSRFLSKTVIGASYTFIFDDNNTDNRFYYKEKTFNFNIAVAITSDIDFGFAILPISTVSVSTPRQRFLLSGVFLQYDFLRRVTGDWRAFVETGFYKGNLCTCGDDVPYYRPNLSYMPFGGGIEKRIFKNRPLFLDASFLWYKIVNKVPDDKWAYSQYVIGLNYHFTEN